jgi:hypothetical protein
MENPKQYSNMVSESNRSAKGTKEKDIPSSVKKMRFENRVALNGTEWETSLKGVYALHELTHFCSTLFNLALSKQDTPSAAVQRNLEKEIEGIKTQLKESKKVWDVMNQVKKGDKSTKKENVKTEDKSTDESSSSMPDDTASTKSTQVPVVKSAEVKSDKENEVEFIGLVGFGDDFVEELECRLQALRESYMDVTEDLNREAKKAEERGVRPVVFFANGTVRMLKKTDKYPFEVTYKGRKCYCARETASCYGERMTAFNCIVESVCVQGGVKQETIDSVDKGNVAELLRVITTAVVPRGRAQVIVDVKARLIQLRKEPNELFSVFLNRLALIKRQANDVDYHLDRDDMKRYVQDSLRMSTCQMTMKVYENLMYNSKGFKEMTHDEICDRMEEQMETFEEIKMTNDREDVESELREEIKRKRKEKKEMKKALKTQTAEGQQQSQQQQQKRQQQPQKSTQQKSTQQKSAQQNREHYICINYNEDKCTFGDNCHFKHDKVTKAELELLKKQKEGALRKKAEIVCYSCEQKGHYANSPLCSNFAVRASVSKADRSQSGQESVSRTQLVTKSQSDQYDRFEGMTSRMSDEQFDKFAARFFKSKENN